MLSTLSHHSKRNILSEIKEASAGKKSKTDRYLKSLRVMNLRLIIGQLNINYLGLKFNLLTHQIKENINILMTTEAKLYESFLISQFFI